MQSLEFFRAFINPLEIQKIPYFVTGSIASIFYGEPRLTHDIDIVIHLNSTEALRFPSFFPLEQFYCPPEEVIQIESRRKPYGHFNLIHHKSGFKADIYPDAGDVLHKWAFQNRKRIEFAKDFEMWLAPAEYVIIRKLEYFREGGSDKHLQDITKMLSQPEVALNLEFLESEIKNRGLQQAWDTIQKK